MWRKTFRKNILQLKERKISTGWVRKGSSNVKVNIYTCDVAIIGGGFCGCMVAAQLMKQAEGKLNILLIEKGAVPARGVAYGTLDPFHILNVPANKMGAYPEVPDHFFQWLAEHQNAWRHSDPTFAGIELTPHSYVPRHLYGFYLSNILSEASLESLEKGVQLDLLHDEAVDIQPNLCNTLELILASGEKVEAQKVILAIGLPTTRTFPSKGAQNSFHTLWSMKREHPLQGAHLDYLSKEMTVGIIGTGLTMVDAAVSLFERGFPGKIFAISKEGRLPETHKGEILNLDPLTACPLTAKGFLQMLRQEINKRKENGEDWRPIIDKLREQIPIFWSHFSLDERKKVFKWLLPLWNRYRHRMPNSLAAVLQRAVEGKKLEILAGKVIGVEGMGDKTAIKYILKGEDNPQAINVDYVLNCSGPELRLEQNPLPLIKNLVKRGMISPHDTGVGLAVGSDYSVKGPLEGSLYAVGQLLMGEFFEASAVPELRRHCAQLSEECLKVRSGV